MSKKKKNVKSKLPKRKPTKKFCFARRTGTDKYCRRKPGWGTDHSGEGRCKNHGGMSPRGPNHPRWIHGARSKYVERLPEILGKHFIEAAENSDPLNLADEIALTDSLIMQYLENVRKGTAQGGFLNIGNIQKGLAPLIDQRIRLVRADVKRIQVTSDVIFKDRQLLIMERLIGIATTVLAGYPDLLTEFSDQVLELTGGGIEVEK